MNIQTTSINFNGAAFRKFIPKNHNSKQEKLIRESCYKLSNLIGQPTSTLLELTKDSDMRRFSFLQKMVNKFNFYNQNKIGDNSDHILNIYSMVKDPTPMHFNIVAKTKDSFESIERMFTLAKDNESLEFIQNIQYDVLKEKTNTSKIIIDLLSSKNRNKYISSLKDFSSYLKLNAENENAVAELDKLVESGRYNKMRYDAKLAIKNLMRRKNIQVAMAGKTQNLEQAYSAERESFLKKFVISFIPIRSVPSDSTKNTVVDMYRTLNPENTQLRYDIIDKFKYIRNNDKSAEIVEMKVLFDRIDKDADAKKFVQKAIIKDLKIDSVAELNEVLNTTPLKKANVFFNNAKRIIEQTGGEERKAALVNELENPFYKAKEPRKARIIRMHSPYEQNEGIFSKTARFIENKINQFIYNHMAA